MTLQKTDYISSEYPGTFEASGTAGTPGVIGASGATGMPTQSGASAQTGMPAQSGASAQTGMPAQSGTSAQTGMPAQSDIPTQTAMRTDPASFDFEKWETCMNEVLERTPDLLLTEGDRQGEPSLRQEVAAYLYQSRGVVCTWKQVVISAGTQQLVNHLARILKRMGIEHVCTEEPGYTPVRSIFRDWGFAISKIPVRENGVAIEKLPTNVRTAAYVCPQNQFPTGADMPLDHRFLLLDWAEANDSLIIEDDFNSALRPGEPAEPALQGLDEGRRVVYIGTFTPTLFPAVRISYMVLPESMVSIFDAIKMNYDQTCSKTEQLTLARFMHEGWYQGNLDRVRELYARKRRETLDAIEAFGVSGNFLRAENTQAGANIILKIDTHARTITEGSSGSARTDEIRREMADRMIASANALGVKVRSIHQLSHDGQIYLIFNYHQIPLEEIREAVKDMTSAFKSAVMLGGLNMPSVYEVVRLTNGRPQFLKEHFQRLENSLGSIGKAVPFTYEMLEASIRELVEEGHISDHNLKLEVDVSGHSILYMSPTHYPSPQQYAEGVRTELFSGMRKNPNIKMMDQSLRDRTDAAIKEHGLYEVILVDRDGYITEGSRSNVFFIKNGEAYTSPLHQVLPGVTRRKIIDILRGRGIAVHEEPILAADIGAFDAAFLSGTSPKVLPIASVGWTVEECAAGGTGEKGAAGGNVEAGSASLCRNENRRVDFDVNDSLLRSLMDWYDQMCRQG